MGTRLTEGGGRSEFLGKRDCHPWSRVLETLVWEDRGDLRTIRTGGPSDELANLLGTGRDPRRKGGRTVRGRSRGFEKLGKDCTKIVKGFKHYLWD